LSRSTGARPEVDVALLTALLASYIWLWQGAFPGDFFVCATLYLGIGVWSHWRRNETAADIGLRVDNFGPAVWFGMKLVGPIILAAVALGTFLGTIGPPEQTGVVEVAGSLAWGMAWATVQQYGLACVYYRRLKDLLGSHAGATLGASAVFAALHLPNPFLVPVTFVGGVIACQVYRRAPNLFVLGLLHVLLSNALRLSFGPAITHHMRVGPGYWHV
jgi:membrane protease YdiL (CAAX protease family)